MADCLFCQLIKENKPEYIYQDEQVVAFPDISPKAPHHFLIVPRTHIASINEVDPEHEALLGHLFTVAKELAKELKITGSGYRLVVNTGPDAGQTVFHIHMHLLGGDALGRMTTAEPA